MEKRIVLLRKTVLAYLIFVFNQVQSKLIHWVFFPMISIKFGYGLACLFLVLAIIVMGYIQLRGYEKAQAILHSKSTLSKVAKGEVKTSFQLLLWILSKCNRFVVLIVLSTQLDPFLVTVYLHDSKKLIWKRKVIFSISLIISVVFTTIVVDQLKGVYLYFFTAPV